MTIRKTITLLTLLTVITWLGCKKEETPPTTTLPTEKLSINSHSPSKDAINVSLNKIVVINFNEQIDATTITDATFKLMAGNDIVTGDVTSSGVTAIFKPDMPLVENTLYTATITTDVKSISGKMLATNYTWSFTTGILSTNLEPIELGTSANFVILAKSAINNNPISAITGDIGISPAATTYITGFSLTDATGFATSSQITGKVYAADMVTPTSENMTIAINDMTIAYNDASGRTLPDFVEYGTGNIGNKILLPGLYKWTSNVTSQSDLTITGSANDVWIFQIDGNLTISPAVNIVLAGGAKAENIFWQVAGEVVLGTTSNFKGIVLSKTGITMNTATVFTGRALAQTAVTIDASVVSQP